MALKYQTINGSNYMRSQVFEDWYSSSKTSWLRILKPGTRIWMIENNQIKLVKVHSKVEGAVFENVVKQTFDQIDPQEHTDIIEEYCPTFDDPQKKSITIDDGQSFKKIANKYLFNTHREAKLALDEQNIHKSKE